VLCRLILSVSTCSFGKRGKGIGVPGRPWPGSPCGWVEGGLAEKKDLSGSWMKRSIMGRTG
jgi:hypothetical protein